MTLHPGRMMECQSANPFVVGVTKCEPREQICKQSFYCAHFSILRDSQNVISSSFHALLPSHPLGRERVSRCSVDSRSSCNRVLVIVVTTNSSASATSSCLLIVLRVFTLSRFVSSVLTPQANLISQDVAYRHEQSRTRWRKNFSPCHAR